jgi:acetyl-CoA C-acetyltransferase
MHRVAIVGGKRLPFVKSFTHYREHTAKDLLVEVLNGVSQEFDLKGKTIPEVILGAVTKHAQDWNLAREAVLGSELGPCTPAYDVQRACGTSFEACQNIANKIKLGQIEFGIGGGVDTNSDAPITLNRRLTKLLVQISQTKTFAQKIKLLRNFHPKDLIPQAPKVTEPRTGLSMGEHCELMVKEWGINRTEQDQWALESHQKAASAYENGFFENTILSF